MMGGSSTRRKRDWVTLLLMATMIWHSYLGVGVCRVVQAATSVVSSYYPLIGAGAAVAPCPPHTEGRYIYTPVRGD